MSAPKTRTQGARRAAVAGNRPTAGETTGTTAPINRYLGRLSGANRSYGQSYVSAVTRGTSMDSAVTRGADAGLTPATMQEIESQIDSLSRGITDRRRRGNR